MYDYTEVELKTLCCTCLARDRKLFQLCKQYNGVNIFYLLLSRDAEAYKEGFLHDLTQMHVCWECLALLSKFQRFQRQVCSAQGLLAQILNGHTSSHKPLSQLSDYHKTTCDLFLISASDSVENFVDCNALGGVKVEPDSEDVSMALLGGEGFGDGGGKRIKEEIDEKHIVEIELPENNNPKNERNKKVRKPNKNTKKIKTKAKPLTQTIKGRMKKPYTVVRMSEREILDYKEKWKSGEVTNVDDAMKCVPCLLVFKTQIELEDHRLASHVEKPNHTKCKICECYIEDDVFPKHLHTAIFACNTCGTVVCTEPNIWQHLKTVHGIQKGEESDVVSVAAKSKGAPRQHQCPECPQKFPNSTQAWKHVQRCHRPRARFACDQCGKTFSFRCNLTRHLLTHAPPPPRVPCATCGRSVRVDLQTAHARTHTRTHRWHCATCDVTLASLASYRQHLKTTAAHANSSDILKYKCPTCDAGYRSRGELRDHQHYRHRRTTLHHCPHCGKALATRRGITRHVNRAHRGLAERTRDLMCQHCGKSFRSNKCLSEHLLIHTGERPLACAECGASFRQAAALYTHRKRKHGVHNTKVPVTIVEGTPDNLKSNF